MLATDTKRTLVTRIAELKKLLVTHNMSLAFEEWSGPSLPAAKPTGNTPEELKLIGGEYSPVSRRFKSKDVEPALTLPIAAQQTAPLKSNGNHVCIFGGQRSGKSVLGLYIALKQMLSKPGSIVFYAVPTYQKAAIISEPFLELMRPWISKKKTNTHDYELINGSKLKIWSVYGGERKEEGFLGRECDLFILEEFREMEDRVYQKAMSRVATRRGRMVIVSSPQTNHMLEDIENGEFSEADFEVYRLTPFKNFFPWTDEDDPHKSLRDMKKVYDDRRYRRDVLGEFVADTGFDFPNFDTTKHVISVKKGTPVTSLLWNSDLWLQQDSNYERGETWTSNIKADYVLGMDFGATIASALVGVITLDDNLVCYGPHDIDYDNANLEIIKELYKHDTNIKEFIQTVILASGLTPDNTVIFCDPSGTRREIVSGHGPVDYLVALGFNVYWEKKSFRQPGIDAVNTRFFMNRLFINSSCKETINSLTRVRSKGKTRSMISRDPFGHFPDALRYIVAQLFPEREAMVPDSKYHSSLLETYKRLRK